MQAGGRLDLTNAVTATNVKINVLCVIADLLEDNTDLYLQCKDISVKIRFSNMNRVELKLDSEH